ncbi:hypothetical protein AM501_03495 [Aneurinibacillus migulanus]|uniref:hypothetical protein n=1 Tax=Aneurinibacillus migulanus TaxID=47500 RepID=UPI0005BCA826|nr:hypothetical protein [Aneurinibacillus migulanus]KIV55067.1 hypothetical protein TS64_12390 [Aneurinibacillus migulanus]KPD09588.1 hypothetical protein AM501_03495 [Aneurinibacillus migulanus]
MAKKALSFRFPEEFVTLLRTWSFVTEKEQRVLLEEAFAEYAEKRPELKETVERIMNELP